MANEPKSEAEQLALLPETEREEFLNSLTQDEARALEYCWPFYARKEQIAPPGDWKTWLILAGRGFGKTRAGAEWVRSMVCGPTPTQKGHCSHIALIGETAKDTRDVMVEGESGLLAVHPPEFRPEYQPSNARVIWPNGAVATLYNATEPGQLRGPQFDLAWLDELAKWRYAQDTYDMLQFGLRLGSDPRQIITTTPRPTPLVKALVKDPMCAVTRGSTYDNIANLAKSFIKEVEQRYEGTRLGKQELHADILEDIQGALWRQEMVEKNRCRPADIPPLVRVVVAVDPSVADTKTTDDTHSETGIVVAGIDKEGIGYVLDDASCVASPDEWARRAIAAYDRFEGDRIVCETNQGGAMVKLVVRSVRDVPVTEVKASKGKVARAEPISALYEQDRIKHVGFFEKLEEQMLQFIPGVPPAKSDRVDALVWALASLFPSTIPKVAKGSDFDEDDFTVWNHTSDFGLIR